MEVGAETAACVAAEGYRFAYFYILVGFYEYFRQVAVDCFKTVGVTEDYIVPVASAFEVCEAYTSGECGINRVAGLQFEVDSLMFATEAWTVAVGGGHISGAGHREVAYVDGLHVGYFHSGICIDAFAVPAFGVDVEFGFGFILEQVVKEVLCILHRDLVPDVFLSCDEIFVLGRMGAWQAVGLRCDADCCNGCECCYCKFP